VLIITLAGADYAAGGDYQCRWRCRSFFPEIIRY